MTKINLNKHIDRARMQTQLHKRNDQLLRENIHLSILEGRYEERLAGPIFCYIVLGIALLSQILGMTVEFKEYFHGALKVGVLILLVFIWHLYIKIKIKDLRQLQINNSQEQATIRQKIKNLLQP